MALFRRCKVVLVRFLALIVFGVIYSGSLPAEDLRIAYSAINGAQAPIVI